MGPRENAEKRTPTDVCAFCGAPPVQRCASCGRPLCSQHAVTAPDRECVECMVDDFIARDRRLVAMRLVFLLLQGVYIVLLCVFGDDPIFKDMKEAYVVVLLAVVLGIWAPYYHRRDKLLDG